MIQLCSSSPTRAMLLDKFNIKYIQKSPNYDEDKIKTTIAKDFVYTASLGKLNASITEFGLEYPLLCADTVISSSSQILRKAKSKSDAKQILELQSGSIITIISSLHYKTDKMLFSDISATYYSFYRFDKDDMQSYLDSNIWQGKAGACMVEGFCKKYIKKVYGLESTAMGLQVEKLVPWIK